MAGYNIDEENGDLRFEINGDRAVPKVKSDLLNGLVSGFVRFDQAQGLTEGQKSQGRKNIDAVSRSEAESGNVRYDKLMSLTEDEMEQARDNIDAEKRGVINNFLKRRNGYLSMSETDSAPDQSVGPYGVWIESEEYGIIFQYQAPVAAGKPSITHQIAIDPGIGWKMRQYSSVNNMWTDWVNIGADEGSAIVYNNVQDLSASDMEQAMYNLGLRNFKGKLLVSDLSDMSKIDPEWWCWGETDYFLNSSDDDAKDNNYFWWQSSRMVDGELETCQTRINGRRLQRRTKTGRNTAWGDNWEDVGSVPTATPNIEGKVKIIDVDLVSDLETNAGKAVVCGEDGKIGENVLPKAYDVGRGHTGVVEVVYNSENGSFGRVPMVDEQGILSYTVLPSASPLFKGAVLLSDRQNIGAPSVIRVPWLNGNGVLPVEFTSDYFRRFTYTGTEGSDGSLAIKFHLPVLSATKKAYGTVKGRIWLSGRVGGTNAWYEHVVAWQFDYNGYKGVASYDGLSVTGEVQITYPDSSRMIQWIGGTIVPISRGTDDAGDSWLIPLTEKVTGAGDIETFVRGYCIDSDSLYVLEDNPA